jgi:hypothetical protein
MSDVRLPTAPRGELDRASGTSFARDERVERMLATAGQETSECFAAMLAILEIRHKRGVDGLC